MSTSSRARRPSAETLSRAHGTFNVVTGLWPVVHMRSFEAVSGPKLDRWLVRTVGGLMAVTGLAQLTATPDEQRISRWLGVGTAGWLAAIDLHYASTGRIRRIYLLDAAAELAWVAAWAATGTRVPATRAAATSPDGGATGGRS